MMIQRIIGYEGIINFDSTKPDGMFRKLMDSTKMTDMGWQPKTDLEQGIKLAYEDFVTTKFNVLE
jgi:GDP-L-fucose synthase